MVFLAGKTFLGAVVKNKCEKPEWSYMKGFKIRLMTLYFILQNQPSPRPFSYLPLESALDPIFFSLFIDIMVKGVPASVLNLLSVSPFGKWSISVSRPFQMP